MELESKSIKMIAPLIGITTNFEEASSERSFPTREEFEFSHTRWARAVYENGGYPVYISSIVTQQNIDALLERIDGLLLSGGVPDVSPELYGEERHELCGKSNLHRDEFEIALTQKAIDARVPVLGICRGLQIINVSLGGTLYQDLFLTGFKTTTHRNTKQLDYSNRHDIELNPDSQLCNLLGTKIIEVNTSHHQVIKILGKNLRAVAHAKDSVIEAIEYSGGGYVIGVQWHPETMRDSFSSKAIMSDFIKHCGKK